MVTISITKLFAWSSDYSEDIRITKNMVESVSPGDILGTVSQRVTDSTFGTARASLTIFVDDDGVLKLRTGGVVNGYYINGVKRSTLDSNIVQRGWRYAVRTGFGEYYTAYTGEIQVDDDVPLKLYTETNNVKPAIAVTNNTQQVVNSTGNIQIKGSVTDPDEQPLTISATINNIKKTQIIQGPTTNNPFTLTWVATDLPNTATYTTIPVTVSDGIHSTNVKHTAVKMVDKLKPKLNIKVSK